MSHGQATNRDMAYFRAPETTTVVTNKLVGGVVSISRVRSGPTGLGRLDDHALEDAYMVGLQLRPTRADVWLDGRQLDIRHGTTGEIMVYDYRRRWGAEVHCAFDAVNFHVPHSALAGLVSRGRRRGLRDLFIEPGRSIADPTVQGLTMALLPALERPHEANALFVDHVGWAFAAHLAHQYGPVAVADEATPPRLTGRQLGKVKELIDADLSGKIQLSELAAACGLSIGHFSRAFRQTVGMPPYRWLLLRRIEVAKALLKSDLPLAELALRCGFSDQSHLNRVFKRAVGQTPGAWRSQRL